MREGVKRQHARAPASRACRKTPSCLDVLCLHRKRSAMRHAILLAFLSLSALTPAYAVDERYPDYEPRPGLAGEAPVEGAPAPASLMLLWPESFRMVQPGVALRTGPVEGGVTVKAAVEAVAILVNAENPLTCISLEELHRLYTEENPKWEGGVPAMPLAREAGPGEGDFFAAAVLRGAALR